MRAITKFLYIAWASPNTILGAGIGAVGLLSGAQVQLKRGVVEFHGGLVGRILQLGPRGGFAAAITLGHTILGQDEDALDRCRDHEHVHVRQYERWGPLFLPAYVLCWLVLRVRGRDGYRENPFERQAYEETEIDGSPRPQAGKRETGGKPVTPSR
jgi:hypothetical protein